MDESTIITTTSSYNCVKLNKLIQHYILTLLCCKLSSFQTLEEYIQSYYYRTEYTYKKTDRFDAIRYFLEVPYIKDLSLVCKDWFEYLSILNYRYFYQPQLANDCIRETSIDELKSDDDDDDDDDSDSSSDSDSDSDSSSKLQASKSSQSQTPKINNLSNKDIISKLESPNSLYQFNNITHLYISNQSRVASETFHKNIIDFIQKFPNLQLITLNTQYIALFKDIINHFKNNNLVVYELYIKFNDIRFARDSHRKPDDWNVENIKSMAALMKDVQPTLEFVHLDYNSLKYIDKSSPFCTTYQVKSIFVHRNRFDTKYSFTWEGLQYVEFEKQCHVSLTDMNSIVQLNNHQIKSIRAKVGLGKLGNTSQSLDNNVSSSIEKWESLCTLLANNKTLKELYLTNMNYRQPVTDQLILERSSLAVSNALRTNATLERLSISCHILSQSFYDCMNGNVNRTLRYLRLRDYNLEHLRSISTMLLHNTTLCELDITSVFNYKYITSTTRI
ncbi:hypothetical protein PPL_02796 [Heterostelium album PN500]|uniref:Uncharacterized protein n=1 Tax=Heterostelium pallidum (strain ATCC 26659 / Pp 5 / PN500) TaxID=670386 RepID=D3B331_HETP5|nr:hypothetical protein PPL_02796 [Heterostelium album PN500]EFA83729.1 hypothetical protein PPL_02796 [Heterostelium album PN500]|eukprot:XP_020435846.1 hypothetical protein PPL_02796 [Heterostelium album PN500]